MTTKYAYPRGSRNQLIVCSLLHVLAALSTAGGFRSLVHAPERHGTCTTRSIILLGRISGRSLKHYDIGSLKDTEEAVWG